MGKKVILSIGVVVVLIAVVILANHKSDEALPVATKQTSNSSTPAVTQNPSVPLKDGIYTGNVADAFYGNLQVQAAIQNGKITDITFLQFPNSPGHTSEVSTIALPQLKQEAITSQKAAVDIVSGATQTSEAFRQSLQSALDKAKS